jgi:hypothetical protein
MQYANPGCSDDCTAIDDNSSGEAWNHGGEMYDNNGVRYTRELLCRKWEYLEQLKFLAVTWATIYTVSTPHKYVKSSCSYTLSTKLVPQN